ncbi:stage III sporulation protein AG [Desulfuribacillus stibiiarsenatis]|uniref:Stage III sporulation protein AG n=1 Tax=Desulfuribacillus stibiiarsenatis TaxID=1390249 RepID=A0A1E5L694_9FIRM|nr:stage III sporulation protein AG [Desulfuribacillus stibiiarsenatis]OEH85655.1 stage III sporulation protein AG [Desulfuribacillus stibiiarsenatis]
MDLKGNMTPMRWLVLLGAVGMVLLIVVADFNVSQSLPKETSELLSTPSKLTIDTAGMREYEELYEKKLEIILEKVAGVGQVSVMVNIDSTEEVVLGSNIRSTKRNTDETDRQGGNRKVTELTEDNQIVILRGNNGGETPVVMKKLKPNIRGVIVVAEGASNIRTHAVLSEAVQRALNVGANKISILPMNTNEKRP